MARKNHEDTIRKVATALVLIGGVNWGLHALSWNLVDQVAGITMPVIGTIVYVLVAVSALYLAYDEYVK